MSPSGRYLFVLSCSGNWQGRAVHVAFAAISGPALPRGEIQPEAVACQAQPVQAQVSVDPATTRQLQQSGPMILMTFTVVQRAPDGTGYVSVGPRLTDMAVMMSDARPAE